MSTVHNDMNYYMTNYRYLLVTTESTSSVTNSNECDKNKPIKPLPTLFVVCVTPDNTNMLHNCTKSVLQNNHVIELVIRNNHIA